MGEHKTNASETRHQKPLKRVRREEPRRETKMANETLTGGEMQNLPTDAKQEILSRLPIDSLIRSRYVCKPWLNLTNDPRLSIMHTTKNPNPNTLIVFSVWGSDVYLISDFESCNKTPIKLTNLPFQPLSKWSECLPIVGSLHGFICFTKLVDSSLELNVWNPLRGDWVVLPHSLNLPEFGRHNLSFAFGYTPNSKQYKVMRTMRIDHTQGVNVEILTLGSDIWRKIATVAKKVCWASPAVYHNGHLHWLFFHDGPMLVGIFAFDVDKETFHVLPIPDSITREIHVGDLRLGVLGDCLILFHSNTQDLIVWMMKEYGVEESWVHGFVIPRRPKVGGGCKMLEPLRLQKNGNVLLREYGGRVVEDDVLCSYNPMKGEQGKHHVVEVSGLPRTFQAVSLRGTLLTLKEAIAMEGI